jgi:transcriptional regulator of acetoin/glycerol metabolism
MKMTPGQAEVAETVLEQLAEVGPRFVAAHEAVVQANKDRKALRDQLLVLVRQGQVVNANMSELARAVGVSRQTLYTWLKETG